ncbi:MAG: ABC transporter permease [Limnobacter sp.]|uniref:ABC transporter permease n=1 Tax=Limnobacter sp. TaxID=2003368 RepID=UPI003918DBB7
MPVWTFWRTQWRRPAFRVLVLALVLAVAAITSVGVFSARIESALLRDASQMLGGDFVLETKRKPDLAPWWSTLSQPQYKGLSRSESVEFPSVLQAGERDLLVSVKVVDDTYPLRGQLRIQSSQAAEQAVKHGPPPGQVWVDSGVLGSLNIRLGDSIELGALHLPVTATILIEPDRSAGFVNFAPRVLFNRADLQASGLLGLGSRATWRVYFAGDQGLLSQLQGQVKPQLTPVDQVATLESGRPEVNGTLTRARDFLAMAALIGTLVACVGIGLVAHVFARELASELAILKSLGYTPGQLGRLWLGGLLGLALAAGLLGVALGWGAHWVLVLMLSKLLGVALPMAGVHFVFVGVLLAVGLLLGFAGVPAVIALKAPAIAVIRNQRLANTRVEWALTIAFGVCCGMAVCLLLVSNTTLALLLFSGFLACGFVFAAALWVLLTLAGQSVQRSAGASLWGSVMRSMAQRKSLLVLQGVSLTMGLSALLMLAVVQGDLMDRWRAAVPDNAPNRFVFNIQPDQVDSVRASLQQATEVPVRLYPMVRGRLTSINGNPVTAETFTEQRARNLVQREFNLSFADELPRRNTVIQGRWFTADAREELSIESSMAQRLGLTLGDTLEFDIAGTPVRAKVTSIRDLRWDSLDVNFFVLFPGQALSAYPQTWITSVHLPVSTAAAVSRQLVRDHPNLTVLDTEVIMSQARRILAQVSQAVQFVFGFTVLAGGLVVVACVLVGAQARARETAIFRALGASSQQLLRAAWLELALIGGLSGLIAASAAQALGWSAARFVFEFDYWMTPWLWLGGAGLGAVVSLLFGGRAVYRVCTVPVMQSLRQAD